MNIIYAFRQILGMLTFHKRVYIHGSFKVGNRKNVKIGNNCAINEGVYILGRCNTQIGNGVVMSAKSMLIDSGLDISHPTRPHTSSFIEIKDNAWIGAGAIILPGVTIGEGSIVGAGSVVTKSIPDYCIAAGNPAKVIKQLDNAHAINPIMAAQVIDDHA